MLFKNITILNEDLNARQNMFVGTAGDHIDYIGEAMPMEPSIYGEIYEGKGKLLMAGFVNSHAHSPMTLMRGYGENLALQDWLGSKIFPFEAKLRDEDVYNGTLLAMAESLRFGIVSTTDMYYFSEAMIRAIIESGTKNNLSRSITNFTGADLWSMEGALEMKTLFEKYHGAEQGRIRVDMSLHAEYTSDPGTAKALADYTRSIGANMHVHVSETRFEHEACKDKYGLTPTRYFAEQGIFDTRTTAAHCVWIEGEDFDILKEKGVTVACNPISNLKLASGVCNVPELLKRDVNVAIGTDSVASNNSLNFIEEIKTFALVSKMYYGDPTAVTPLEALRAATLGGAIGQGRNDCGKLAVGYKADLIVLDIDQPHMNPVHNILNNIVYSASGSDVVLTMVDGRVLYKDGGYATIDIERAIFEVEKSTNRILSEL